MQLIKEIEIEREEEFLFNTIQNTLRLSREKISTVEVFIKKTIGISVNVRNNIIENVVFNSDGALFITVYNRFSKGSVSSKDFTLNGIEKMLNTAIHISKYTSSDFCSGLPESKLLYSKKLNLDLFYPWKFNITDSIKMVRLSETAAFKHDKRIVNSEGSFFNSFITIVVFGNSLGMLETYKSTLHSISTCVIAKDHDSMQRDFDYSIARKIEDLDRADYVGKKTATRAIARLGSRKIKTNKSPVIFSTEISSSLFSYLISAISGINVYQKSTFLIDDLKKKIFPDWLNIEENPHLKKGLGSQPFDNEGVATYTKKIIKNGILQTWLLNSYIAKKLGQSSTGNSGSVYNWIISHKNLSFSDLLKEMNCGLLVTELMGQGVDIISGNYSRGIVGFWIENGNITYPVHEITISGNLRDMWKNIISISKDVDYRQKIQCGSVLLSEMQISGH